VSAAVLDDLIGPYRDGVERLARRIAELHTALATPTSDSAFAPEPSTVFSRRSAYQRMRGSAVMLFELLHARTPVLSENTRDLAGAVLRHSEPILASLRTMLECPLTAIRIRCHGNLHLGQILCAGTDLVIIDFDGEPGRPLYERRLKRSPLHDVATLVRSFHYAAHVALARERPDGSPRADHLGAWMRAWQRRVGSLFVAAYAASLGDGILPADRPETDLLLRLSLLDRAIYECRFELNRGSKWLAAPLADIPVLLSP
jgi:maltose alpha-D-glucosyltransferase / alpha-amylase